MNEECRTFAYKDISVGDAASFDITITEELVNDFARISGDMNPLHVSEGYAAETSFGHRIAHGMIAGMLFSRLIGMRLPGKYTLYLSQTLRFHAPIYVNTKITVRGEVAHKTDSQKSIAIRMIAEDSNTKKPLVTGEALIKLLK